MGLWGCWWRYNLVSEHHNCVDCGFNTFPGAPPRELAEFLMNRDTLLGNLESAELSMLRLKGVGVCFALDDFGTGYSNLLYLRRFPFDKLKIDSSFVRSIEKAADAAAIVHAVVSLGRGLGMKVTAEGVETAEQHLFLRAFDARLPLRPAGDRGRDRTSPRRARGLPGHQSRSGNRGRDLTGCHSGQQPFPSVRERPDCESNPDGRAWPQF